MASNIKHVTTDNFEAEVLQAEKPVLVDFWAAWCGPCSMLAPAFEALAEEMQETAVFAKVNIDEDRDLAANYKVMSIPTLVLFKDGQPVKKSIGVITKQKMKELIESV